MASEVKRVSPQTKLEVSRDAYEVWREQQRKQGVRIGTLDIKAFFDGFALGVKQAEQFLLKRRRVR